MWLAPSRWMLKYSGRSAVRSYFLELLTDLSSHINSNVKLWIPWNAFLKVLCSPYLWSLFFLFGSLLRVLWHSNMQKIRKVLGSCAFCEMRFWNPVTACLCIASFLEFLGSKFLLMWASMSITNWLDSKWLRITPYSLIWLEGNRRLFDGIKTPRDDKCPCF